MVLGGMADVGDNQIMEFGVCVQIRRAMTLDICFLKGVM